MTDVNRYFGWPWNSAMARRAPAPTPIGAPCLHCDELFVNGDQGLLIPGPVHRECLVRMMCGSVGHQLKKCACFGGTEEDPQGMTKREAARAAAALWESTHQREYA